MENRHCHPLLIPLIPVVRVLGATLGRNYEIVLHDLSQDPPFIVAMENGDLTGRDMETPLTSFGEYLMKASEISDQDYLANYPSEAPDGRKLRSSVAFIRDEGGSLTGFLCINYDMLQAQVLKDMSEFLTAITPLSLAGMEGEKFSPGSSDRLETLLQETRKNMGKPLRFAKKKERYHAMEWLEERGFFDLKGAIPALAGEFVKSRYTLYGDLRKIRNRGELSN
ncbi:MAG: transcriptional regulator [Synergistales bacterium]|nr:transcriptional regulator [Synergistales bacterium]